MFSLTNDNYVTFVEEYSKEVQGIELRVGGTDTDATLMKTDNGGVDWIIIATGHAKYVWYALGAWGMYNLTGNSWISR